MNPDEFRDSVLPSVVAAWGDRCFCGNPGFRKLISFDFRDYGIGPTALADAEILIEAIVRKRFTRQHEPESHDGETLQVYSCPQCALSCTERYAEFSISMYQSTVSYDGHPALAARGLFLVGFYGFSRKQFEKIDDFEAAPTADEFIRRLTIA